MVFQVPSNTSINRVVSPGKPYFIGFAPELIPLILEGKKQSTYRLGKKYDYINLGDEIEIQNSQTNETVARAVITNKHLSTFKNLPVAVDEHESYRDKEHQRKVLSGYYAYIGRSIQDEDVFLIFEFHLIIQKR